MNSKILVIEDEKRIADWIQRYLENAGYQIHVSYNGTKGLKYALHERVDLIVLDIELPGIDGIEICKRVRTESDVPIIMLTARDTYSDRIIGLETGADDYIVKPFDPEEMVARVKAVLRRVQGKTTVTQQVGAFELNTDEQNIYLKGKQLNLTVQQFEILVVFMRNPGRVMTREQIIDEAFDDFDGFDRAVDTHIRRLRKLIETDINQPGFIQTVYGAGYRFVPE